MFGWIKRLATGIRRAYAPIEVPPAPEFVFGWSGDGEPRLTEAEWRRLYCGTWAEPPAVVEVTQDDHTGIVLPHGGRADTALAAGIPPSVPVGLLPPGNEEFRRQRIADAMKNDPAAKYMRGPASR